MPITTVTPRHVLYVEDDRLNIVLMEEVFRRLPPDWTLDCVEDGGQALLAVAERRPDLLLIDMHLPDMNGLELLARLAEQTSQDALPPCVALSADALPEQVQAARAAGFCDYWLKPIDVLRLAQALQEFAPR